MGERSCCQRLAGLALAVSLIGCTPPSPSVAELRSEPVTQAPVSQATLLGERVQEPSAGLLMGTPVRAQLEQVWVSPLGVEQLADAYVELLADRYEVQRQPASGGTGIRVSGVGVEAAVTVTILPDGPAVLAGEAPPPLDPTPDDTASWATVLLTGRGEG
ncbi:hypothetical protein BH23ACT9_BH23ACT9_34350 [soil metagenome]